MVDRARGLYCQVIGTWNYPIMLTLVPVAGAIAAGNTVILKPSNVSPNVANLLARLIPKYLDPKIVAVAGPGIKGDRASIQKLLANRFDKIFFTGMCGVFTLGMSPRTNAVFVRWPHRRPYGDESRG